MRRRVESAYVISHANVDAVEALKNATGPPYAFLYVAGTWLPVRTSVAGDLNWENNGAARSTVCAIERCMVS